MRGSPGAGRTAPAICKGYGTRAVTRVAAGFGRKQASEANPGGSSPCRDRAHPTLTPGKTGNLLYPGVPAVQAGQAAPGRRSPRVRHAFAAWRQTGFRVCQPSGRVCIFRCAFAKPAGQLARTHDEHAERGARASAPPRTRPAVGTSARLSPRITRIVCARIPWRYFVRCFTCCAGTWSMP